MVRYCLVHGCRNSSETPNVMINSFPPDLNVRKLWFARLQEDGFENNVGFKFRMKRYYCTRDLINGVCSAHFKPEDFTLVAGEKCLKKGAVPSIFSSSCAKEVDTLTKSSSETNKVDESENSWGDFANLPELVLFKIFNYLTFENRLLAGSVCHSWYGISRSPGVWKEIQIKVPSPYHLLKFIVKLPPSVRYLSIHCLQNDIHNPLWLPDILSRVYQRCPLIKSVIFENVYFSQRFCNTSLTTDHVLCSSQTTKSNDKKGFKNVRDKTVCLNECCRRKQDKYRPENLPEQLTLLSVRLSHSFFAHLSSSLSLFFPKIKVLDLSFSVSVKNAVIPFFTRLSNLEELYLSGCPIRNSGIENLLKHLPKLKVLDLEHSPNVDDDTFQIIQTHGHSLKKLYLGFTSLKRLYTFYELLGNFLPIFQKNEENFFPHLEELCLKATTVDSLSVMHLAINYPSLKFIDLVENENSSSSRNVLENSSSNLVINKRNGQPCFHFKSKYAV